MRSCINRTVGSWPSPSGDTRGMLAVSGCGAGRLRFTVPSGPIGSHMHMTARTGSTWVLALPSGGRLNSGVLQPSMANCCHRWTLTLSRNCGNITRTKVKCSLHLSWGSFPLLSLFLWLRTFPSCLCCAVMLYTVRLSRRRPLGYRDFLRCVLKVAD